MVNVVRYKDPYVCILMWETGFGESFNKEFSKVTSEGYELKVTHPLAHFTIAGSGGDTQHLYFFQRHIELSEKEKEELVKAQQDVEKKLEAIGGVFSKKKSSGLPAGFENPQNP